MTLFVRLSNVEFILPYQNDNYIMVDVVFKRQKESSVNPKKNYVQIKLLIPTKNSNK